MDNEIKHFVTQICLCVKRKKPHIMRAAAMQSISTSELLEIISMDFLHLNKSSGGYIDRRYSTLKIPTMIYTKLSDVATSYQPKNNVEATLKYLMGKNSGYQYLLLVTDLFKKFTQVYVTRNKEGKTAAERFYNDFILKFGLPGKILHDQGKEFGNNLFKHLAQFCNIKRI